MCPRQVPTLTLKEASGPALAALAALVCHLARLKLSHQLTVAADVAPHNLFAGALKLDGATIQNLVCGKQR